MSIIKSSYVASSQQLTSARSRVHKIVVTGFNTNAGTLAFTEVSTNGYGTSVAILIPAAAGLADLNWDPPLIFGSGVSISVPTSVAINVTYEHG